MTDERVITEIDGPIARVWLNRPDKLNGVDFGILDGLVAAAGRIEKDRDVRAVVLSGRGDSFCAGLDFATVNKTPRKVFSHFVPNPLRGTNGFQQSLWAWRRLPVPVVAVTRGHVFGAGIQLALAADFRFTTPDAQWSVLEAKWGLVPDMSGTVPLVEQLPLDLAKRLSMTGEVFTGQQAADWGLATGSDLDPEKPALELVHQLIARSPDSVAATKRLLNEASRRSVRAQFALERRLQLKMFRSPNTKVARAAGARRQDPEFGPRTFG
ncbi:enoyl-CoA hydratase/isomerase family protein [Aeromicrobium marinum DSM 15272]|uniref:Enoyl-CoA hydratase/isomerase family protein n=1 Tax=Aeromicrobium marinum DSM 15272 TaxID=585531 RepID=E2S8U9_9ACTN|nr:crotonase/enoyl-CoA hydratase family protein [Aeromicrobium marinum]EFQ84604.1 enoyl-CoA hydratase/isomerase family protein [Aeromicrobium marinum DSM 15272]